MTFPQVEIPYRWGLLMVGGLAIGGGVGPHHWRWSSGCYLRSWSLKFVCSPLVSCMRVRVVENSEVICTRC